MGLYNPTLVRTEKYPKRRCAYVQIPDGWDSQNECDG